MKPDWGGSLEGIGNEACYWFRETGAADVNFTEIVDDSGRHVCHLTANEVVQLHERCAELMEVINDLLFASDGDYPADSPQGRAWARAYATLKQRQPMNNEGNKAKEIESDWMNDLYREDLAGKL